MKRSAKILVGVKKQILVVGIMAAIRTVVRWKTQEIF